MAESISNTKRYGEFSTFFQYVGVGERGEEQPCLCIGSTGRLNSRRRAWVIPMSEAYRYAGSKSGAPTEELLETLIRMAALLNLHPSRNMLFKLAEAVVDALPELLRMPPNPIDNTRDKIEKAIERQGLKVQVDGENIVG